MAKKGKYKVRQIETYDGSFLMSPKNDYCFKQIFGDEKNKDLLISFLSAVMRIKPERFADLELANTELMREFVEDRKGILDVKVKLKDGIEIDIEIQLSYTKYMAERTLYYWSKMYTGNIATGDGYSSLKKCVTINILDFVSIPVDKVYSKFHITEDETGYRLTDVLEIYYLELPKLNDEKLQDTIDENDPIIQWMMFLEAENREVLDMLAEKSPEIKKATSILEVMSKSKKERMLYESREAQLHDIATNLEEAREEGREEGKIEAIKALIRGGMKVDDIIKYMGLSRKEVEEIKKQMNN